MLFVYGLTTLITATWIYSWIKAKKIVITRTPLDLPIFLFLLSQVLSTIFSIDPHTSLWGYYSRFHGGLASTISYILLFYAFVSQGFSPAGGRSKTKVSPGVEPAKSYINTILLSTGLISVYAVLERLGIDKHIWVQDVQSRVFSTLGQPNWLSAYLVAILPLPIFMYLKDKKLPHLLLSLLIITSIIFTKSQSGIAATGLTLFLILTYQAYRHKKLTILSVSSILLLGSALLLKPQALTTTLNSLNQINPFYSTTQEIAQKDLETRGNGGSNSMAIRRVVWQGAIDLGLKHPLLGTGVETFAYSYYQQRPASHNLLSEWDFLYNKAHNEYLNFFATTGFLGLSSYLLLIIYTIRWWSRTIRNNSKNSKSIDTALFIGWLSILITNFFGFSVVAVGLLFFLFPALAISLQPKNSKKPNTFSYSLPSSIGIYLNPLIIIISIYFLSSIVKTFQADLAYNLSKSQAAANQNQSALDLLTKAINLQPNQPLFVAKMAEQEAKVAATIFLQLENLPESAQGLQQQHQERALDHATKALSMNPYNLNNLKSQARTAIYLSNIDSKYTQQALDALLQASILAPTDPKLLFNIGILYQNLGKPKLAIASLKKALELKPNYPEAAHQLKQLQ